MFTKITSRHVLAAALLGGAVAVLASLAFMAYRVFVPPPRSAEVVDDFRTVRFLLPQEPTTAFPFQSVRTAAALLNPAELVLGVTVGKEARAYPLNMLNALPGRKILNDTLGGQAIAATW